MYRVLKTLHTDADEVDIIPTGDWHYGSPNCNVKKIHELFDKNPTAYFILMGDLWDCIIPTDKRYEPNNDFRVLDEHYDIIRQWLLPLKSRILVAVTGNHEYKLQSSGHGDLTLRLCRELGVPYGGFSCFLKLKVEPDPHEKGPTFYIHHGWVAGRKTGSVINAVENLCQYYEADCYLIGHSHKLSSTKQTRLHWSGSTDILFCNTGTFLETATWNKTGYAERAGYPPQRLGSLKLKYYPKKGKLYASE